MQVKDELSHYNGTGISLDLRSPYCAPYTPSSRVRSGAIKPQGAVRNAARWFPVCFEETCVSCSLEEPIAESRWFKVAQPDLHVLAHQKTIGYTGHSHCAHDYPDLAPCPHFRGSSRPRDRTFHRKYNHHAEDSPGPHYRGYKNYRHYTPYNRGTIALKAARNWATSNQPFSYPHQLSLPRGRPRLRQSCHEREFVRPHVGPVRGHVNRTGYRKRPQPPPTPVYGPRRVWGSENRRQVQ
jgi:hypothetical protein